MLSVGLLSLLVFCRFHFRKAATSIATYDAEITNFVHWNAYLGGYDWSSAWVIGSLWVTLHDAECDAKLSESSLRVRCAYTGSKNFIKSKFSTLLFFCTN